MINRRHLRKKVMQMLYAYRHDDELSEGKLIKLLERTIDRSSELVIYQLFMLVKIGDYVLKDAAIRAQKHLPTAADKHINTMLAEHPFLLALKDSKFFKKKVEQAGFEHLDHGDAVKEVFITLFETPQYRKFCETQPGPKEYKKIIQFIYKDVMMEHELMLQHFDDEFVNWADDDGLAHSQVLKMIREFDYEHAKTDLFQGWDIKDEWEFARDLMLLSIKHDAELNDHIADKLKNWDEGRVARVDMILMKMAVCELIYFPTIPVKVSINEYIELAKKYSTPKSKDFVNGVLDRTMNELKAAGKINKKGRGLVE